MTQNRPARWVPTLYFAEGIPFFAVSLMAGVLYKRMVMWGKIAPMGRLPVTIPGLH